MELGPCTYAKEIAPMIAAGGAVVTACLTAFLAHRRLRADAETASHRLRELASSEQSHRQLETIERKLNGN